MFGELLGLWCAQAWRDQGSPEPARLVELGPGRGTLMADMLRATQHVPGFHAAIGVVMVDRAAPARDPAGASGGFGARIAWQEKFDAAGPPAFLVANELFDALPVASSCETERGWCERVVVSDGDDGLAFALSPVPSPLGIAAPDGAIVELSPASEALAEEIGTAIAGAGGAALIVDYGYGRPGFGETLQAIGRHEFRDLLETPGEIRSAAHVDFARLALLLLHVAGRI